MDAMQEFNERIRQAARKPKVKACVIDDNIDLDRNITNHIECTCNRMDIKLFLKFLKMAGADYFMKKYDCLFFDATYEDGISTLEILEKLIASNPEYAKISRVMIGNDILEYARMDQNTDTVFLVERAQKLPYIKYGREFGTKSENIIKTIKSMGRQKGIEVHDVSPKGTCRTELKEEVKDRLSSLRPMMQRQAAIAANLTSIRDKFQPTNEAERELLQKIEILYKSLTYNAHYINGTLELIDGSVSLSEGRKQNEAINDSNEEYLQ